MLPLPPRGACVACILALLLLVPGVARAGVPVLLPEREDALQWMPYFAVVDFEAVAFAPASGPWVQLRSAGDLWEVIAVTADGAVHVRRVAAPVSGREREDVVSIANSLLNPPKWTEPSWDELASALPGGGDVFPSPPPTPAPPAPEPAPSPPAVSTAPPAPPEPAPAPVATAPQPEPAPEPIAASPPPDPFAPEPSEPDPPTTTDALLSVATVVPAPPPRTGPWIRTGVAYAGRQGVESGVGVDISGGVIIDRSLRVGLLVSGMTPAKIAGIPGKRTSGDLDVGLLLNYVAPTIGLMFGVQGGYGWRVFESEGAPFAAIGTAWFSPVIGWDIPLGRLPLRLEPYGAVRVDTRPIDIEVQDSGVSTVRRGVVAWRGGLRLVFEPTGDSQTRARGAVSASPSRRQGADPATGSYSVIHPARPRH